MTESDDASRGLRADLIEMLRAARAVEREVFAALDPADRDTPPADGGWSAKDNLAHLSAWRRRQTDRMAARREGRAEPELAATEIDDINAIFHAERADWPWDRVATDAEATAEGLTAEVTAASDEMLGDPKLVGSVLADGPEHDLGHLPDIAARVGLGPRVAALAESTAVRIDRGDWPARTAAVARYNLACFHALAGRLEPARALLRQALSEQEDLRTWAPQDDDLIALRPEIASLAGTR